jgi:hypothetical protein
MTTTLLTARLGDPAVRFRQLLGVPVTQAQLADYVVLHFTAVGQPVTVLFAADHAVAVYCAYPADRPLQAVIEAQATLFLPELVETQRTQAASTEHALFISDTGWAVALRSCPAAVIATLMTGRAAAQERSGRATSLPARRPTATPDGITD